jgi:hypothetical protein
MDNPCFCRIHSADDTVSVLREAQIFFGAQRVRDAIRNDRGISCERLVEVIDAGWSFEPNLFQAIPSVFTRSGPPQSGKNRIAREY